MPYTGLGSPRHCWPSLQTLSCIIHSGPAGVYNPEITGVVFGFDYPQPLHPMMHYVGPVMSRRKEAFTDELQMWLDKHLPGHVFYISMGSILNITNQLAMSLVEAAVESNCRFRYQAISRFMLSTLF